MSTRLQNRSTPDRIQAEVRPIPLGRRLLPGAALALALALLTSCGGQGGIPQGSQIPAPARPRPVAQKLFSSWNFEEGIRETPWSTPGDLVQATVRQTVRHSGEYCLLLRDQPGRRGEVLLESAPVSLPSSTRCRVTAWVLQASDRGAGRPILRVTLTQGGRPLPSAPPCRGDSAFRGVWQRLEAVFTTPPGTECQARLALERESSMGGLLWYLDDVRVESIPQD